MPACALDELSELLADWRAPLDGVMDRLRVKRRHQQWATRQSSSRLVKKMSGGEELKRLALAAATPSEGAPRSSLKPGHVVVFIGDEATTTPATCTAYPDTSSSRGWHLFGSPSSTGQIAWREKSWLGHL